MAVARLSLLAVSLVMVLVVFELGLRLAGYQAIYDLYSKPTVFWQADPELGWVHTPSTESVYIGPRPWPIEFESNVRINSIGLRGPEVPSSEPDELRILFMGDSMVAAFEVDYEESFVHVLSEELAQRLDRPVRGINAGVRGYGTDQSLIFFQKYGLGFDPDVVVFFHSRNDLNNNRTIHKMRRPMGKPAFVKRNGALELVGSPAPTYPICSEYVVSPAGEIERLDGLAGRSMCRLQLVLFDHSALFSFLTLRIPWDAGALRDLYYLGFAQKPETKAERVSDRPIAELTRALIDALRGEAESSGAAFLVIGEDDQLAEVGDDILRAEGIEVLGLGDRGDITITQFKNDSHYTAAGHRRVVDRIGPRLEELLRSRSDTGAPGEPDGPL